MNKHSLIHPTVIAKIDCAMRKAITASKKTTNGIGYGWVASKKGNTICHVRYIRKANGMTELKFFDSKVEDCTAIVRSALISSVKEN